MRKFLILLLACLTVLPALAACNKQTHTTPGTATSGVASGTQSPADTEPETDEWGRVIEPTDFDVSGLDFGGEKLTVLCAGNDENGYWAMDPGLYKKPSDALEMALYKRNMQIEQDLGLTLKVAYKPANGASSELNKTVETDAKSGLNEYDIVVNYAAYGVVENLRGYYMGQYRDKSSHVVMAEYRQMLNTDRSTWLKRMLNHIGFVAWTGCGFMGPTPGKIEGVLPNYGVGLRIEVQPRMNVRLDLGKNTVNNQMLFYFNMTEAF